MKKIILSSRELSAAKLPNKPVTYLGEPLKISKSKDPYTMYIEYNNAGNLLSPTSEWKVLVEIGYKAKGSKSWKKKHATIEGAPGQVWGDDSKGSLAKALADANADLGNIIDQNTMNDYSRIITQDAVPTVEIKQYIEDPRAWKADTKQRKNQINQQKQQQKAMPAAKTPTKAPAKTQTTQVNPTATPQDDEDMDQFSNVSDFKEQQAYMPRKDITYNDMLADRNIAPYIDQNKTNLNSSDSLSTQDKYFMVRKEKGASGDEYLIFSGPKKGNAAIQLAITIDGAKNLFKKTKTTDVDMDASYKSYEQTRKAALAKNNNDPDATFKSVGYDMYNLFIPYKIKGSIPLGPDEWAAIHKGELTKNSPHFAKILKDENTFSQAMTLLSDFRKKLAAGTVPSATEEDALKKLDMHEIFDDIWDYFEEGGKQKLLTQQQGNTKPQTPKAKGPGPANPTQNKGKATNQAVPAKAKPTATLPGQKINVQANLSDEDIIAKFADVIFKEDNK